MMRPVDHQQSTTPARDPRDEPTRPEEAPGGHRPPDLLGFLDGLGALLRDGFPFLAALLALLLGPMDALAHAPVARVWINGVDLDGPPGGVVKIPGWVGASIWPTNITGHFLTRDGGGPATRAEPESVTGLNLTLSGRSGLNSAELDLFAVDQTTTDRFLFDDTVFPTGAVLKQNDVVARGSREIIRMDCPWGLYHADLGLRITSASRTADRAGVERVRTHMFMSPELQIHGRWLADDAFGIHARLSYATNAASIEKEEATELLVMLNYHTICTDTQVHDLAIGVRALALDLVFASDTGQETLVSNRYFGPELTYSVRF